MIIFKSNSLANKMRCLHVIMNQCNSVASFQMHIIEKSHFLNMYNKKGYITFE